MGYVKGLTTYRNGLMTESEIQEAMAAYDGRYTYADYLTWDDDIRLELIDGVAYMMAAPSVWHQELSGNLYDQFKAFLKGKTCKVLYAPISVRLNADTLDDTVVEPDLIVVCDDTKIIKACIMGAPDLVVEILSPSTSRREYFLKFEAYLYAGVREYWVIDPEEKLVQGHVYENGHFISLGFKKDAVISSAVLPGFSVELKSLWAAAQT